MSRRRIGRRPRILGAAAVAAVILPAAVSLSGQAKATASSVPRAAAAPSSAPRCTAGDRAALPAMTSIWRTNGWGSAQNEAVTARIASDQQYLAGHGVQLAQWGPDSITNRVMVHLVRYSAAIAAVVRARYGCAVIVAPGSQPLAQVTSRVNDRAPFSGGDFIVTPVAPGVVAQCTGGPIVRLSKTAGIFRMLTAGHCTGPRRMTFRSNRRAQIGPHIGNFTAGSFCNNCLDAAYISGRFIAFLQIGGDNNRFKDIEDGTAFPSPFLCKGGRPGCARDLVTQDSAVTGEITRITVVAVNQMVRVRCGRSMCTIVGLSKARKGSTVIIREGDSGGPWMVPAGGALERIAGISQSELPGGKTAFFEQIGPILRQFGGFVPTP